MVLIRGRKYSKTTAAELNDNADCGFNEDIVHNMGKKTTEVTAAEVNATMMYVTRFNWAVQVEHSVK